MEQAKACLNGQPKLQVYTAEKLRVNFSNFFFFIIFFFKQLPIAGICVPLLVTPILFLFLSCSFHFSSRTKIYGNLSYGNLSSSPRTDRRLWRRLHIDRVKKTFVHVLGSVPRLRTWCGHGANGVFFELSLLYYWHNIYKNLVDACCSSIIACRCLPLPLIVWAWGVLEINQMLSRCSARIPWL